MVVVIEIVIMKIIRRRKVVIINKNINKVELDEVAPPPEDVAVR